MNKRIFGRKIDSYFICVLVLLLILVINLTGFFFRVLQDPWSRYANEYSWLSRNVEDRDYPSLYDGIQENRAKGVTPQKDTAQLEALAEYWNAAMLRHACAVTADPAGEALQVKRMKDLEPRMTEPKVQAAAAEIRDLFCLSGQ